MLPGLEPPDPGTVRRFAAARARAAPLRKMLREHCRFTHAPTGAEFRQRRLNEVAILAKFTVTRADGIAKTFSYGEENSALDFAEADEVKGRYVGKDHPMLKGR